MPRRHVAGPRWELRNRSGRHRRRSDHGGSSDNAAILFSSLAASSAPGRGFFCSVMLGQVEAVAIVAAMCAGSAPASMSLAGLAPETTALMSLYAAHFAGSSLSSKIAVVGHSGSHAPQSMHSSGLIASEFLPS